MSQFEQRANIKFMFKLGKSAADTLRALETVYGDAALKKTAMYKWFDRFKSGQESLDDEARSGRPSTSRNEEMVARVKELVHSDRRLTIHQIMDVTGISCGSVHAILTDDLGMHRVCAKFVPRMLTVDQMACRMTICGELFERSTADPTFLDRTITGDETWAYGYDPETRQESSEWHTPSSPRPKKSRLVRSKLKVLLTVFFDKQGIVHYEFLPPGTTVTGQYYTAVLGRLRAAVRRKRRQKWTAGWFLHHDNAPSHTSLVVRQYLAQNQITVMPQPPYSPDVAPCDFWLFPLLKKHLRGHHFQSVPEIQQNVKAALRSVKRDAFKDCFKAWEDRWSKCVCAEGRYFEGD